MYPVQKLNKSNKRSTLNVKNIDYINLYMDGYGAKPCGEIVK